MNRLRHRLYEQAVQSPEIDIAFLERAHERHVGGWARTLREDFCGTALLAARWVESDDEREACGVDLDAEALALAEHHGLDDEERARLTLLCADARTRTGRAYDVVVAGNFSWALLEDDALAEYLAAARAGTDGLLALELFGGPQLETPRVERHRCEGFTYVWTQRPVARGRLEATLGFELDDGRRLADAFRYRFVLRDVSVVEAMLRTAGFEQVALYVEDRRGRRTRRPRPPRDPIWRGFLIAV